VSVRLHATDTAIGAAVPVTVLPQAAGKHGGWRDPADDQGQLFGGQGQCVRFVVARRS